MTCVRLNGPFFHTFRISPFLPPSERTLTQKYLTYHFSDTSEESWRRCSYLFIECNDYEAYVKLARSQTFIKCSHASYNIMVVRTTPILITTSSPAIHARTSDPGTVLDVSRALSSIVGWVKERKRVSGFVLCDQLQTSTYYPYPLKASEKVSEGAVYHFPLFPRMRKSLTGSIASEASATDSESEGAGARCIHHKTDGR